MSPDEFTQERRRLRFTQIDFAELVGVRSDRTVRRWEEGTKEIPGPVELLVELMLEVPEVLDYLDLELDD